MFPLPTKYWNNKPDIEIRVRGRTHQILLLLTDRQKNWCVLTLRAGMADDSRVMCQLPSILSDVTFFQLMIRVTHTAVPRSVLYLFLHPLNVKTTEAWWSGEMWLIHMRPAHMTERRTTQGYSCLSCTSSHPGASALLPLPLAPVAHLSSSSSERFSLILSPLTLCDCCPWAPLHICLHFI